ncbi:polynucleotide kinase 3'-phosphatase [Aspergillus campestris IBT 28561]|uniref:Polynucleotide kinase 3'-phosphatase n=1 Tax=Aspergillus campestris (strain IBT 28561) TaxID=1392248 RepID=A0A2I1D2D3_ASPC2|nr:polynucleotide kinase 3'-phosphatase [Aspergillus campestris IBT 28561]PKY04040.1 polynucleotide kinase 3'-phosphatase [Aspergillus campestris IBT 28561]
MAGAGAAKRPGSPDRAISPPPLKRKVGSTITKKAASSFFTPTSQKKPERLVWRVVSNSLVVGRYSADSDGERKRDGGKPRVAAFDLDSTLVSTASGNTFPRNSSDWKWWHDTVPSKLQQLNKDGYHVVIMSNQKKVSIQKEIKAGRSDSKSLTNFKERAAAVMEKLDIPISVYAATEDDSYRKPRTGMWKEYLDDQDFDVEGVDLKGSIYVGDAAGRPRDHSQVDRGFAVNVGLPFQTPEEFFLNAAPEPLVEPFDPTVYLESDPTDNVPAPFSRNSPVELVIFCGSPGAGKSTFYWNYLQPLGYERANQDLLKTRPKCIKVAKEYLAAGKSVVVDNTNADPETRAHWVSVAKESGVPIRCVYFTASQDLCRHNNAVRAANQDLNPESRTLLPGIAFGDFGRRFKEPSLSEGFEDIVRVDFRFHGSEQSKGVWGRYWI